MESYYMCVSDLQAQFEEAVAWVEEGQGHRVIEIEGDNGVKTYMVSPALIDYMEARIDSLNQR